MEYLSEGTRQLINVVGEVSHTIEFELGPCMAKPVTGDMAWFLLTDQDKGVDNMYIVVITPYGIFGEYNFGEDRGFAIITDIGDLLEGLQKLGYRRLSKGEISYFFSDGEEA